MMKIYQYRGACANQTNRHAEPKIISMSRHVSECINAGLTSSTGIANDLESTDEGDLVPRLLGYLR